MSQETFFTVECLVRAQLVNLEKKEENDKSEAS